MKTTPLPPTFLRDESITPNTTKVSVPASTAGGTGRRGRPKKS